MLQQALSLHQAGRLPEARAAYELLLKQNPRDADALHLYGVLLHQFGDHTAGESHVRKAIQLSGGHPAYYQNLGAICMAQQRFDDALQAYERCVAMNANSVEGHSGMTSALNELRRYDAALAHGQRAIQINPNFAEAWGNLGSTLRLRGELQPSLQAYQRAMALQPNRQGMALNLASVCSSLGRSQEAIELYRREIAMFPNGAEAHVGLAHQLLCAGQWADGWREYEWRWRWAGFPSPRREFAQPAWAGESIEGKTLLIYAEQGLGDAMQFARYLPMVLERGAKVIWECQAELVDLFARSFLDVHIVARNAALPNFDYHVASMSLPLIFGTTIKTVPGAGGYLIADPARVQTWREKLSPPCDGKKVGLVWAGNPRHRRDRERSCSWAQMSRLLDRTGAKYFSLQKGVAAEQLPGDARIINLDPLLQSFDDTAAALANLDLLITVDTAIAHLAGALGRPTWLMVTHAPDWRWLANRPDTPWYNAVRIFRQPTPGDWTSVIEAIMGALVL